MSEVRPRFDPVARRTVPEEVRAALIEAMRTGALPPGAPLPSERELTVEFGVARTSVREAIQGLSSLGLVERRGNRLRVVERFPEVAIEDDARRRRIEELFEVRRVVEVPLAEFAALRAGEQDKAELLALAQRFSPDLDIAEFRALDRAFHWAVAAAAGNELLAELYYKVLESLFRSYEFAELLHAARNGEAVRQVIARAGAGHVAMAEAIASGQVSEAAKSAEAHVCDVANDIIVRML